MNNGDVFDVERDTPSDLDYNPPEKDCGGKVEDGRGATLDGYIQVSDSSALDQFLLNAKASWALREKVPMIRKDDVPEGCLAVQNNSEQGGFIFAAKEVWLEAYPQSNR